MAYLQNLGRSVAYAVPGILKGNLQNLYSLTKLVKSPRETLKGVVDDAKEVFKDEETGNIGQQLRVMWRNAERSIRTGNLWDESRAKEIMPWLDETLASDASFGGGEMDFGGGEAMDLDSIMPSDGETGGTSDETVETPKATVVMPVDNRKQITVADSGATARTVVKTSVVTGKIIVAAAQNTTRAVSALTSATAHGFTQMGELLSSMRTQQSAYAAASLAQMGRIADAAIQSVDELKVIKAASIPKELAASTAPGYLANIIDPQTGAFSVTGYFKYLKHKIDMRLPTDMITMLLSDMAAAPLESVFQHVGDFLFSRGPMRDLKEFSKGLAMTGVFALRRFAGESDDARGFVPKLLRLLNIEADYAGTTRVALQRSAEVQTVPFDTETKRSIVETIPMFLGRILAALQGRTDSGYLIHDSRTGQLRDSRDIIADFNQGKAMAMEMSLEHGNPLDDMLRRDRSLTTSLEEDAAKAGLMGVLQEMAESGEHLSKRNISRLWDRYGNQENAADIDRLHGYVANMTEGDLRKLNEMMLRGGAGIQDFMRDSLMDNLAVGISNASVRQAFADANLVRAQKTDPGTLTPEQSAEQNMVRLIRAGKAYGADQETISRLSSMHGIRGVRQQRTTNKPQLDKARAAEARWLETSMSGRSLATLPELDLDERYEDEDPRTRQYGANFLGRWRERIDKRLFGGTPGKTSSPDGMDDLLGGADLLDGAPEPAKPAAPGAAAARAAAAASAAADERAMPVRVVGEVLDSDTRRSIVESIPMWLELILDALLEGEPGERRGGWARRPGTTAAAPDETPGAVRRAVDAVGRSVNAVKEIVAEKAEGVADRLADRAGKTVAAARGRIAETREALREPTARAVERISETAAKARDAARETAEAAGKRMTRTAERFGEVVKERVVEPAMKTLESTKGYLKRTGETLREAAREGAGSIRKHLVEPLKEAVVGAKGRIRESLSGVVATFRERVSEGMKGGLIEKARERIDGFVDKSLTRFDAFAKRMGERLFGEDGVIAKAGKAVADKFVEPFRENLKKAKTWIGERSMEAVTSFLKNKEGKLSEGAMAGAKKSGGIMGLIGMGAGGLALGPLGALVGGAVMGGAGARMGARDAEAGGDGMQWFRDRVTKPAKEFMREKEKELRGAGKKGGMLGLLGAGAGGLLLGPWGALAGGATLGGVGALIGWKDAEEGTESSWFKTNVVKPIKERYGKLTKNMRLALGGGILGAGAGGALGAAYASPLLSAAGGIVGSFMGLGSAGALAGSAAGVLLGASLGGKAGAGIGANLDNMKKWVRENVADKAGDYFKTAGKKIEGQANRQLIGAVAGGAGGAVYIGGWLGGVLGETMGLGPVGQAAGVLAGGMWGAGLGAAAGRYLDRLNPLNLIKRIQREYFGENSEGSFFERLTANVGNIRDKIMLALFGDGSDEGMVARQAKAATSYFHREIIFPFQDMLRNQMEGWRDFFNESVMNPLIKSFDGLGAGIRDRIWGAVESLGRGIRNTASMMRNVLGRFFDGDGMLAKVLHRSLVVPTRWLMGRMVSMTSGLLKGFIAAPVKLFGRFADWARMGNLGDVQDLDERRRLGVKLDAQIQRRNLARAAAGKDLQERVDFDQLMAGEGEYAESRRSRRKRERLAKKAEAFGKTPEGAAQRTAAAAEQAVSLDEQAEKTRGSMLDTLREMLGHMRGDKTAGSPASKTAAALPGGMSGAAAVTADAFREEQKEKEAAENTSVFRRMSMRFQKGTAENTGGLLKHSKGWWGRILGMLAFVAKPLMAILGFLGMGGLVAKLAGGMGLLLKGGGMLATGAMATLRGVTAFAKNPAAAVRAGGAAVARGGARVGGRVAGAGRAAMRGLGRLGPLAAVAAPLMGYFDVKSNLAKSEEEMDEGRGKRTLGAAAKYGVMGASIGTMVGGPLGTLVGGGVGALAGVAIANVDKIVKAWEVTVAKVKDVADRMWTWTTETWSGIKNFGKETWDSAKEMWTGAKEWVMSAPRRALGALLEFRDKIRTTISNMVSGAWTSLKETVAETWETISSFVDRTFTFKNIARMLGKAAVALTSWIPGVGTSVKKAFSSFDWFTEDESKTATAANGEAEQIRILTERNREEIAKITDAHKSELQSMQAQIDDLRSRLLNAGGGADADKQTEALERIAAATEATAGKEPAKVNVVVDGTEKDAYEMAADEFEDRVSRNPDGGVAVAPLRNRGAQARRHGRARRVANQETGEWAGATF